MEELLNKLIEKGWKPFGKEYERYAHGCLIYKYKENPGVFSIGQYPTTYRELCAKESGLWQFVCENGMIGDGKLKHNWVSQVERGLDVDCKRKVYPINYEYRLIESALCDEDKLEQFLLDNIKVEG